MACRECWTFGQVQLEFKLSFRRSHTLDFNFMASPSTWLTSVALTKTKKRPNQPSNSVASALHTLFLEILFLHSIWFMMTCCRGLETKAARSSLGVMIFYLSNTHAFKSFESSSLLDHKKSSQPSHSLCFLYKHECDAVKRAGNLCWAFFLCNFFSVSKRRYGYTC